MREIDNLKEIENKPKIFDSIKSESDTTIDEARRDIKDRIENNTYTDNLDSKSKDEPYIRYYENGTTEYFDDNGKKYRINDDLIPDSSYEINGYQYKTDSQGRIQSVNGNLHLKEHEGRLTIRDSKETIGKGDQKENDNRGHLVGDQFGGTNGLENIVSQDKIENSTDYANLEKKLADHLKKGDKVTVEIKVYFDGKSNRPSAIVYSYSINGEKNVRIFPNGGIK